MRSKSIELKKQMSEHKYFLWKRIAMVISLVFVIGMLVACDDSIGFGNNGERAESYPVVLEDLTEGENAPALAYVNSLGFTDADFRKSFYEYLADGKGNCFINAKQEDVVSLEISGVTDLTDLRLFPNLRKVKISASSVTDYSSLGNLKHLEVLSFYDTDVDCTSLDHITTKKLEFFHSTLWNTEALSNLKGIFSLEANYSHMGNIEFLADWSSLQEVTLCNADITSFEPLKEKKLDYLRVSNCQVSDWTFLKDMSVKQLDLSFTNFEDFSLIEGADVSFLDLSYTFVRNLYGISAFKNLKELHLDSCYGLDGFDEVQNIEKLKTISCTNLEMNTDKTAAQMIIANVDKYAGSDYEAKDMVLDFYNGIGIKDNLTDSEKARLIVEAVLDQITFGKADTPEDSYYCNTHELKSALDGIGNCASYSGFTSALLSLAGIENVNIAGENFEDNESYLHRWNVVKIDGEWKGLDVTFLEDVENAREMLGNGENPEYFLSNLSDPIWMEYHFPYYMPETDDTVNFAR